MLIAVEGVTGIGKSTLQKDICEYYGACSLSIDYASNHYLTLPNHVNDGDVNTSLDRELIFMIIGYHQLKSLPAGESLLISDFAFNRFPVFASAVLEAHEMEDLFLPCYRYLKRDLGEPAAIIRLTASPDFVIDRIRKRNRNDEEYFDAAYISSVESEFGRSDLFKNRNTITIYAESYDLFSGNREITGIARQLEAVVPEIGDLAKNA